MTINQIILLVLVLITTLIIMNQYIDKEDFGALQSLYSNDGIQDQYLTTNDSYYDPYKYWRLIPWNLPTRNLNQMVFYPFLYENYIDRYGTIYPYW